MYFRTISQYYLGLLQRSLCALPINYTERDALWFRGEGPGHGGSSRSHSNGDDAVTARLDEELPRAFPKS